MVYQIIKSKYIYIILVLALFLGFFLRLEFFSQFLTYVDSYKYLVNAESFSSSISYSYSQTHNVTGKWGYSVLLGLLAIPFGLQNNELIVFAKYFNIVISLLIGIIFFLKYKKHWILSMPFFLSPVFIFYSSYVITEYLTILLTFFAFFILENILKKDISKKFLIINIILLSLILGYLPFIRLEFALLTALICLLTLEKNLKRGATLIFGSLIVYLGVIYLLSLYLNQYIDLNKSFRQFFQPNFALAGIAALVLYMIFLLIRKRVKENLNKPLAFILTLGYLIFLIFAPNFSFIYKNILNYDLPLYAFLIAALIAISALMIIFKKNISDLALVKLFFLCGLTAVYLVFNKDIDRYALTIISIMILILAQFLTDFGLEDLLGKVKIAVISLLLLTIFVLSSLYSASFYGPRSNDFQQSIIQKLDRNKIEKEKPVYTSGYIYYSYLYFEDKLPLNADRININTIKPNSYILLDPGLKLENNSLYNAVKSDEKFELVQIIKSDTPFAYSNTVLEEEKNVYLYMRKESQDEK